MSIPHQHPLPPQYPSDHAHYTRRPSSSSLSLSPVDRARSARGMSGEGSGSAGGERRNGHERPHAPPRANPSSASRMSLSALVNSPPHPHVSPPSPRAIHHPPQTHTHNRNHSYTSSHSQSHSYHPPPSFPYSSANRYVSPQAERYPPQTPSYPLIARTHSYESYRSPSPAYHPSPSHGLVNGIGNHESAPGPSRRAMVPDVRLAGSEEVWEEMLRGYQKRREAEAAEIAQLDQVDPTSQVQASPSISMPSRQEVEYEPYQPQPVAAGGPASTSTPVPSNPDDAAKVPAKRKGWPSDHPTRVSQREAKEAAVAAGLELPKRNYNRKTKREKAAELDDELLGLAEGEVGQSSPMPTSDVFDADSAEDDPPPEPFDPNIVLPCGLTRAEVIAKVESNDMFGLTEDDVKAVQDEMWMRKKDLVGGAPIRKNGTVRRKPGPAKGWKKLRGDPGPGRRDSSIKGDYESEAGDTANAGDTVNGEAGADIAALLPDGGPRLKRQKLDNDEEDEDEDIKPDLYDEEDIQRGSLDESGQNRPTPKNAKTKEPGVGKGRWTRPTKPEKDLLKKAEELAVQVEAEVYEDEAIPLNAELLAPNSQDLRGISETEAKVRLGLVEELQRQAWFSIVRDIPRMYRVYQAYDTVVKQDCSRKAQAAVRNAFGQRTLKPTYKSAARINKDAGSKAKRVIKEMLMYWRKNEKDELVARKKAEKEALDRAKAEEEARESKRQARKLNFLLTQTELYSHFIGKKIKTAEAEDTYGTGEMQVEANEELGLDAGGEPLPDIDYDDDDEENLRKHAARGAQAAVQAARDKARAFDESIGGKPAELDLDGDELNFQNPSMGENQITITQPKMLTAQLKEYQLKGLTWLGNLYEQGINGILADEMGLGKTIQSISLLAYLAEHHNLWGPFLVIAPSSTLHNWQQELVRFVPQMKAIPYWGTPKDRETLRRIWSRKNMTFSEDSPFHILVTSYQLAVQDEKYFQGMRWQYMILDEAQAIKSSSSARWKSLLSLHCRNRLLLTGTPIQNSMHELWALLHFIMPSLFDSHEEFSEWFSKDIENAAGGGSGTLKPEQLRRLHMILKPFMLRRVKKHVQKELGDKIEIDVLVDLSQRQRNIYKALRQRVSVSDLMAQANNLNDSLGAKNLMNLVMQFRKVCNHPDLFERADVVSPFLFGTFSQSGNFAREGDMLYCPDSARNAIDVRIPKILWTDGGKLDVPGEESLAGSDTHLLRNLMSIWTPGWIAESLRKDQSQYGFLRLMGSSPGQASRRATSHPLVSLLRDSETSKQAVEYGAFESDHDFAASARRRFEAIPPRLPNVGATFEQRQKNVTPLLDITLKSWNQSYLSRRAARFAVENAVAPFIKPVAPNRSFINTQSRLANDPLVQKAIYGVTLSERDDPAACARLADLAPGVPPIGLLAAAQQDQAPLSSMRVPAIKRLIVDSAKLARLDDLLHKLKDGGHRVLLYFQMTKMMDLVEEYLIYRQYKYLRLDGSSPISERRDMVSSWQTNPDIFVFCLSTRAGGLGINLTAADTVIFYDHDWNPSNDAQAMDRAHRVGQTKQVTVYRLIARGTIEERIVKLARAKKDVQDVVVGTKSLTDVAKPSEIVSLFMDDEELAESVAKRKQAEAHGYTAPSIITARPRSAFADGLGMADDDEDDFFSLAKKPANNEDEDFGDEAGTGTNSGTRTPEVKEKSNKLKAGGGDGTKRPHKKKVKIALGPDGLPI